MQQIHGYTQCHWMPPLGKYLPHIAPADAMVINFGVPLRDKFCIWQFFVSNNNELLQQHIIVLLKLFEYKQIIFNSNKMNCLFTSFYCINHTIIFILNSCSVYNMTTICHLTILSLTIYCILETI